MVFGIVVFIIQALIFLISNMILSGMSDELFLFLFFLSLGDGLLALWPLFLNISRRYDYDDGKTKGGIIFSALAIVLCIIIVIMLGSKMF